MQRPGTAVRGEPRPPAQSPSAAAPGAASLSALGEQLPPAEGRGSDRNPLQAVGCQRTNRFWPGAKFST